MSPKKTEIFSIDSKESIRFGLELLKNESVYFARLIETELLAPVNLEDNRGNHINICDILGLIL